MRLTILSVLAILSFVSAAFAQQAVPPRAVEDVGSFSNLPAQPIGPDDLVAVTVYDSPELSRTIRVSADGTLRLPMLRQKIHAQGKMPSDLETAIAEALKADGILVDPVVSVSIAEYRSRPISVAGEVRSPVTFQALPGMTLLDAITRAGGLSDEAGPDIIVTRSTKDPDGQIHEINQRIPAKGLLDASDPTLNLALAGGEQIRVPPAGRIYVVGNVKMPGAIKVHEANDATVFKAIAMSQGLQLYSQKVAYIYRKEAGQAGEDGIPVQLSDIMHRKAPDVPLQANDILYIPENGAQRVTVEVLKASVGVA
ncbi:MAG: polysaccharide biosynthesis/export family protein, partial [Bryobacteraceae bacterium]